MRTTLSSLFYSLILLTTASVNASDLSSAVDERGIQVRSLSAGSSTDHPPGNGVVPMVVSPLAEDPAISVVESVHPTTGATVDEQGAISGGKSAGSAGIARLAASSQSLSAQSSAAPVTITSFTFGETYGQQYNPENGLVLFGRARTYSLSDGRTWNSGAGSYRTARAKLDYVEVEGTTIRYHFHAPEEGFVYSQTDYNSGDHSSNGVLANYGPIVLEAEIGSDTATITSEVEIVSNTPANYPPPRFNFWDAPVGAIAPYEASFTLDNGGVFSETSFDTAQRINYAGSVDFSAARRPPLVSIDVVGSRKVPNGTTTQFFAIAIYEGGSREDVTAKAEWQTGPYDPASVDGGALTVNDGGCEFTGISLAAKITIDGTTRSDKLSLTCVDPSASSLSEEWETFQGDERHSGYMPVSLDTDSFALRWRKQLLPGYALNPVTAADGKVFASVARRFDAGESLFVLDSRDGHILWSKAFDSVNSVNPPAYGYGNVYIQTGDHSDNTHLWALDANSGDQVFKSPHSAQWERYYAPTIFKGEIYINGGYYGGVYAFNAFTGANKWFRDLPQYDQYTPAVDEERVYAYVGEYDPALYVVDRESGAEVFRIRDPNFDWRGWSMNLAPVLGDLNNVVVIHNNRLLSFDLENRDIGFEITENFVGQPAVAKGMIYAINGGGVEARRENDGSFVWRWTPESGTAEDHVIVTDSHVLARTATHTYAIDALSGLEDWSYPEAGRMALGNEELYIASGDTLIAISMPGFIPSPLIGLEVTGPAAINEFSEVQYSAIAKYADGRERDRSAISEWQLTPAPWASVDDSGTLGVDELPNPAETLELEATYREDGVEVSSDITIDVSIGVSQQAFVSRNIQSANEAKRLAITALKEVERRERAIIAATDEDSNPGIVARMRDALLNTLYAIAFANRSLELTEEDDE